MKKFINFIKKASTSINSRVRLILTFISFLSGLALDDEIRNKLFTYWKNKQVLNKKLKLYNENKERIKLLLYKNKTSHEILFENAFTFYTKNYSNDLSRIRNERLDRFLKQKYLRPFVRKKELNKKTKKYLY
jgi:phage pi2 protein 07